MTSGEGKRAVYDALQQSRQLAPFLDGAVLVKFVAVCDFALPDGEHAIVKMGSDADGQDLRSWEAEGLMFNMLARSVAS